MEFPGPLQCRAGPCLPTCNVPGTGENGLHRPANAVQYYRINNASQIQKSKGVTDMARTLPKQNAVIETSEAQIG